MALNYIWVGFFLIAFAVGLIKLIFFGDVEIFSTMMKALFERSKLGFELSLGLTGILALWMGIMKIGEKGGMINILAKAVSPLFTKLFPEVPKNHPAIGSMMMNFSANMLGLDNAATPLGLKAMKDLQELNPDKETASNAQIMFLVLNTSGLTLIPVSILALRAMKGSVNPTDVFLPILIATFISSMVGLIYTAFVQKINLFQPVVMAYLGGMTLLIGGIAGYVYYLNDPEKISIFTNLLSNILLFSIIITFISVAFFKKINIYDAFIEGAKDGFQVAVTIIPYLVAMLAAIGVFTASGAMDYVLDFFRFIFSHIGMDTRFVDGLPTAFMKPLTGGGARAAMVESWVNHGVDGFVGHLTSILQGSTETTFYVLAVYFGSVGIKNTRYAALAGIIADIAGIIAAIFVTYLFFGNLS
jgi:spore maturation protein SpmA